MTNTSSSVVLNIVYTNTQDSVGAFVSVDYSDLVGGYSVSSFTSNPNADALPFLKIVLSSTTDNGSIVSNIQAVGLPPGSGGGLGYLPAGQSYLLGTITFHKDGGAVGVFTAESFLGSNDAVAGNGVTICNSVEFSQCSFGSSTVTSVPEPTTGLLLALGLAGFVLADHHRKN